MELHFVSSSGLKYKAYKGYLMEFSTHVTSELRSEVTLVTQETETQKKGEEVCPRSFSQ